jgi:hypothetical protein
MAKIKDAREIENLVYSFYSPIDMQPSDLIIKKHGTTWVATWNIMTVMRVEKHNIHVAGNTGKILSKE